MPRSTRPARRTLAAAALAVSLALSLSTPASAEYPEKPVTVILPNKAGGAADINLRIMARHLERYVDQKVIVKNVPGGGTATGTRAAYDAPKDGYTMMFFHQAFMGTAAQGILKRDFHDMEPIARTGGIDIMYVSSKSAPFTGLSELVSYSRANPDTVKVGVYLHAHSHIVALSVMDTLGVKFKMVNVPGGGGPIRAALLGGKIDLGISLPGIAAKYVESGDLKPVVFFANYKPKAMADLETAEEAGHPELTYNVTNYWWMHKDVPDEAKIYWAGKLEQLMADAALRDELGQRIEDLRFSSGPVLRQEVDAEYARYSAVVEKYGLKKE